MIWITFAKGPSTNILVSRWHHWKVVEMLGVGPSGKCLGHRWCDLKGTGGLWALLLLCHILTPSIMHCLIWSPKQWNQISKTVAQNKPFPLQVNYIRYFIIVAQSCLIQIRRTKMIHANDRHEANNQKITIITTSYIVSLCHLLPIWISNFLRRVSCFFLMHPSKNQA